MVILNVIIIVIILTIKRKLFQQFFRQCGSRYFSKKKFTKAPARKGASRRS